MRRADDRQKEIKGEEEKELMMLTSDKWRNGEEERWEKKESDSQVWQVKTGWKGCKAEEKECRDES